MVKVTGNNMHGIITKMLFELPFFAKSTAKKNCHIIAFCHIIEVDGIVNKLRLFCTENGFYE